MRLYSSISEKSFFILGWPCVCTSDITRSHVTHTAYEGELKVIHSIFHEIYSLFRCALFCCGNIITSWRIHRIDLPVLLVTLPRLAQLSRFQWSNWVEYGYNRPVPRHNTTKHERCICFRKSCIGSAVNKAPPYILLYRISVPKPLMLVHFTIHYRVFTTEAPFINTD